jgi:hypothetical protein
MMKKEPYSGAHANVQCLAFNDTRVGPTQVFYQEKYHTAFIFLVDQSILWHQSLYFENCFI